MNTQQNKKGFTIIEVVLVLAIAALIFLMIFIALPALQRGQRDTARKNDVGTIASAVNTYRSNTRNALPSDAAAFRNNYIDNMSQIELDGITIVSGAGTGPTELDEAIIYTGAKCNNNNNAVDGSSREAAVITLVENGDKYCQSV